MWKHPILVLCAAMFTAAMTLHAEASIKFTVFDVPGALNTVPLSINAGGDIAGRYDKFDGTEGAFLRTADGTITTFNIPGGGTDPGEGTYAFSINDDGEIAGEYLDGEDDSHGYVRSPDGMFTIFTARGTDTFSGHIDAKGRVAGDYFDETRGVYRGFIRMPHGQIRAFDPPGGAAGMTGIRSEAISKGAVAGYFEDNSLVIHGYVRTAGGVFTPFDAPAAASTYAEGINASLETAGDYQTTDMTYHGFLRTSDGTFALFDGPDAANTFTGGLNDKGEVAGYYLDAANKAHGFLRRADGTILPFDVPGFKKKNHDTTPHAINVKGEITGGCFDGTNIHGFLREP